MNSWYHDYLKELTLPAKEIPGKIRSLAMNPILYLNPINTGGGGGVFHPEYCFLPVTFLFLSQFPPNLVTFLKFNTELGEKNRNFRNLQPGSRDMTIFGHGKT